LTTSDIINDGLPILRRRRYPQRLGEKIEAKPILEPFDLSFQPAELHFVPGRTGAFAD
jgi:hypothetical protein